MKKPLSYAQRLALQVHSAAKATQDHSKGASFPYGFHAYAVAANACKGKKLSHNWMT